MRRLQRTVLFVLVLVAVNPALASFHLMVVQEVFFGPPGSDCANPDATPDQIPQYVMLRMTAAAENLVGGAFLRVEDADGNLLGRFGTFTAAVPNGGVVGCVYPNCPAILMGTSAAKDLFTFRFDKIVNAQAARVALPRSGGRVCFVGSAGANVVDCVAWGNFDCTRSGNCSLPNGVRTGDSAANTCDLNFDAPVAPGGVSLGQTLVRTSFNCTTKDNSTQFTVGLPHPVNNAGANNNTDADSDGLMDVLDCNDADNTLQWPPPEVQEVKFAADDVTMSWESQASCAATVTYNVVTGNLAVPPDFSLAICLTPLGTSANSIQDTTVPAMNAGFYYLIRSDHAAACLGSYGLGTSAADGVCP